MMGALNFVAHLFSFVVFCVLLVLLAQKRSRELWLKKLFFSLTGEEGVYIDWPLHFLSRFCELFGIPFHGVGSLRTGALKKLRRNPIFQSLLLYGVDGIEYSVDSQNGVTVKIYFRKKIGDRDLLDRDLSEALQVRVLSFSKDL